MLTKEILGSAKIKAFVTEGMQPRVLSESNSVGHLFGRRAAIAKTGYHQNLLAFSKPDADGFEHDLW